MTPKRLTNFRLDDELLEALQLVKDRDGIPISEQVRRAIRQWVEQRGVKVKAAGQRAVTRRPASVRKQRYCRRA
jgi:hypothetical protein